MVLNRLLAFSGVRKSSDKPERVTRFLVLYFPNFRLERCGYLMTEVAVLCAFQRNALRILALTPAAREAGLCLDMTASQARAMVPQLT